MQSERLVRGKKVRCVLAHDHVLLRQGLRRLLEDEPDFEVVAEAGTAAEALRKVAEHRPDVVISDAGIFGREADQAERCWSSSAIEPSNLASCLWTSITSSAAPDEALIERICAHQR